MPVLPTPPQLPQAPLVPQVVPPNPPAPTHPLPGHADEMLVPDQDDMELEEAELSQPTTLHVWPQSPLQAD
eukprot:4971427-Prorocentrum_lima.AAC.1